MEQILNEKTTLFQIPATLPLVEAFYVASL